MQYIPIYILPAIISMVLAFLTPVTYTVNTKNGEISIFASYFIFRKRLYDSRILSNLNEYKGRNFQKKLTRIQKNARRYESLFHGDLCEEYRYYFACFRAVMSHIRRYKSRIGLRLSKAIISFSLPDPARLALLYGGINTIYTTAVTFLSDYADFKTDLRLLPSIGDENLSYSFIFNARITLFTNMILVHKFVFLRRRWQKKYQKS